MRLKKKFITLVELLIVIAVISLLAGVIGINVSMSLREQRFKDEVALIVDQLRLAQNLMVILKADVHVKIKQDPEGNLIHIEFEAPINKKWKEEIEKPKRVYQVRHINFVDDLPGNDTPGLLDLRFLSGGNAMSKGTMRLSTSKHDNDPGALSRYVTLPGYPKPIKATEKIESDPTDESNWNARLTEFTSQEIQNMGLFNAAETKKTP